MMLVFENQAGGMVLIIVLKPHKLRKIDDLGRKQRLAMEQEFYERYGTERTNGLFVWGKLKKIFRLV